jgi:hypothetical protein
MRRVGKSTPLLTSLRAGGDDRNAALDDRHPVAPFYENDTLGSSFGLIEMLP